MSSAFRFRSFVLSLILSGLVSPLVLSACASAPDTLEEEEGIHEQGPSAAQATEEEEEEDAWEDANR